MKGFLKELKKDTAKEKKDFEEKMKIFSQKVLQAKKICQEYHESLKKEESSIVQKQKEEYESKLK
jgi:hypothetical protein